MAKKDPPASDVENEGSGKQFGVTRDGMREATGSNSEEFALSLFNRAAETIWHRDPQNHDAVKKAYEAAYDALRGIKPRDEMEGMMAAQMVASHNAAMECMRRAMLPNQTFEGRDQNLKHAVKLMGLYERQLAALDKRRGKGKQKITVEHVNVHAGGQAIVGDVNAPSKNVEDNQEHKPPALEDESSSNEDGEELKKALAAKPARKPRS